DSRIAKWRDHRSQVIRGHSNIAIADHQEIVTRLARKAAEFVDLAAWSEVRRADQEANRSLRERGNQPSNDVDRGIILVGNREHDLVIAIVLATKAREVLVRRWIQTADRLQNADRWHEFASRPARGPEVSAGAVDRNQVVHGRQRGDREDGEAQW